MDHLADAAAAAPPVALQPEISSPAAPEESPTPSVPATKKRASKYDAQEARLTKAQVKLQTKMAALLSKKAKFGVPEAGTGRAREITQAAEAVRVATDAVADAEAKLQHIKETENVKRIAAEKRAAEKAEKDAATAPMSDEGRVAMVEEFYLENKRVRNTKDKVVNVWEKYIHPKWIMRIDSGEVSEGDRREHKSLCSKFARERGLFRQHCQLLQAAKVSGADEEAVMLCDTTSKFRTCTTDTFFKFKQQNSPMTVTPLLVNGGNASVGGAANYIRDLFNTDQAEYEGEDESEEEKEDDAGEESDLEEFSRRVFEDVEEADGGRAEGEVGSSKGSEGNEGSDESEATPQETFHNDSEDGLFDDVDDDDDEEEEDEDEDEEPEPERKKRKGPPPVAPEMHPPDQAHKKYRPGSQRQQRAPVKGSTPTAATDGLAEALRLEGVADRKAAKAAQSAAFAEASKARKHERAMMAMMMKAFMKK